MRIGGGWGVIPARALWSLAEEEVFQLGLGGQVGLKMWGQEGGPSEREGPGADGEVELGQGDREQQAVPFTLAGGKLKLPILKSPATWVVWELLPIQDLGRS